MSVVEIVPDKKINPSDKKNSPDRLSRMDLFDDFGIKQVDENENWRGPICLSRFRFFLVRFSFRS